MAEYEDNPFADPFGDQSVTNATNNQQQPNLQDYNPFAENGKTDKSGDLSQPAIMTTTDTPPAYTPSPAAPAVVTNAPPVQPVPGHEELLRRQEELERKAEELQRREQQLASGNYNPRANNWPPMPSWFPVGPCFYQDFELEIPIEFRQTVKRIYYLWMVYVVALFLNLIACLVIFCTDTTYGQTFGLSILWFCLYTPCSICWYRPAYNAFRNDSSMYFFLFFFIFFFQFCFGILMAVGIPQWGYAGWMLGFTLIGKNKAGGAICFIMGTLFGLLAVAYLFFLKKVHSIYRTSGASFDKAQQEFATGFMKNPNVQSAAATAATAAVSSNYK